MVLDVIPNDESPGPDDADAPQACGNGLEKVYPTTAVRYGQMGFIGEFTHAPDMRFTCGGKVVIQSKRGIEIGEQVSLTCAGCSKSVTREQIRAYVRASGPEYCHLDCGRILRQATADDLAEHDHILAGAEPQRHTCQEFAGRHNLSMKVVSCEPLFGGERIIFYFVAEGRVDFRALVKDLALEFQTRIEMRQVGARDEARLVADYETCGRECCCKNFLKCLKPVNMKMAKMQKATLDPSKVSGRCGRLKCCLRYEHVAYEELDRALPKIGATVRTRQGEGLVVARQILTQLLQVETGAGGRLVVPVEDLLKPGEEMPEPAPSVQRPDTRGKAASATEGDVGVRSPDRSRGGRRRPGREPSPGADFPADQPAQPTEHVPAPEDDGDASEPSDQAPALDKRSGPRRRRRRRRRGRPEGPDPGAAAGGRNDGPSGPQPPPSSGD